MHAAGDLPGCEQTRYRSALQVYDAGSLIYAQSAHGVVDLGPEPHGKEGRILDRLRIGWNAALKPMVRAAAYGLVEFRDCAREPP